MLAHMFARMINLILNAIWGSNCAGDSKKEACEKHEVPKQDDYPTYTVDQMKKAIAKAKNCFSNPWVAVLFVVLPVLYLFSPKAATLVPLLVVVGAAALIVQSYLPVYVGLDFSLMGAVLGSILFSPWVGCMTVVLTYVLAMNFPSGHQDALEHERIFLFSALAFIIPIIPLEDLMLKCIVATYIGEFMEMLWHKYGENYPWMMAFLKVFPRSLIYIYVFHKTLVFLV